MVSAFSGLGTALSGLLAQRAALDVIGQNIANANTDGYSRQRVVLQSVAGNTVPAIFSTWQGVGSGTTIGALDRQRDAFLDGQARTQHAQGAYLTGQQGVYSQIQQLVNEPSNTGIQSQLTAFWAGWQDVANNPGDLAARSTLVQAGITVATGLNAAHDGLGALWSNLHDQLGASVAELNNTAGRVADLNQSVVRARQAGLPSNELADQRDRLAMRLADLAGATIYQQVDGSITVALSGSALVNGSTSRALRVAGGLALDQATGNPVSVEWVDTGATATVPSGAAASYLESLNTTVPHHAGAFDQVAATLAGTVNNQHQAGFDLSGTAGEPFFTGTTAATLAVAIADPAKVAAAGSTTGSGGNLDGTNADAIAGLAGTAGGVDLMYRQMVADLGSAAQTINQRASIQGTLVTNADAAVTAASGVNLDEEMTNMLTFQRGYQAAARVMTTIDSVLDTLINHTGAG
ncbi:MAG: flagellar hook-associated protein FlgK [Actinobacteria bacterium]|nr:flagellar hook-associated protein FlgK [Actinomycetota bacterium]